MKSLHFPGEVDFRHARFDGEAKFESAIFEEDAWFESVHFKSDANFKKAKFNANVYFEAAEFYNNAIFTSTTFSGLASFERAKFFLNNSTAWFESTKFQGSTNFTCVEFKHWKNHLRSWVQFTHCEFQRAFSLNTVNTKVPIKFDSCIFHDSWVCFNSAINDLLMLHRCTISQSCEIYQNERIKRFEILSSNFNAGLNCSQNKQIEELTLNGCTFSASSEIALSTIHNLKYSNHSGARLSFLSCNVDPSVSNSMSWDFSNQDCSKLEFRDTPLENIDFLGANITDMFLWGSTWPGKVCRHDEIMTGADTNELDKLKTLYQQLKLNIEKRGSYYEAGKFHYQEMNARLRLAQLKRNFADQGILWLYKVTGCYGESYLRLLVSIILSILITAGMVAGIEQIHSGCWSIFAWLESLVTWFQNIFLLLIPSSFQGDVFTERLHFSSKFVIVFEGIVLIALSALFLMAIHRQFRR